MFIDPQSHSTRPRNFIRRMVLPMAIRFFAIAMILLMVPTATGADEIVHPGVAHSRQDLRFVKDKIDAKEQPWFDAWKKLNADQYASLDYQPQPRPHVERGPYNHPNIGSSEFSHDANAAYIHALIWAISGKEDHAEKSAAILDAWSTTLESISNHDARLLVGISGYKFCIAAELIKHTWDGWPESGQAEFERMVRGIFYPLIKEFYPSANGNWDASMLQTVLAMGVHLDDREMIDSSLEYFRNGVGNGAIGNYFNEFGQCQESGRDQGHTQMGLDFLANTCETAWIQGVDLYGELDNRLLTGFEYTAKYNLGENVPYERFPSYDGRYDYKRISDKSRGRLRPMYEKVLRHFRDRQGIPTPYTEQAVASLRKRQRKRSRDRSSLLADILMFASAPVRNPDSGVSGNRPPRRIEIKTDVVVYGGTSSGIMAAIQLARSGKKVEIVSPGHHIGGLTTGGLGATDIGNKQVIGGLSREFYHRIAEHYRKEESWVHETREEFFAERSKRSNLSETEGEDGTMWTFEPHVASEVLRAMMREVKLHIRSGQQLVAVEKDGNTITSIQTDENLVFTAKIFIDASYEGDLMARAGVRYRVGREGNAEFDETLNGIREKTPKNQIYGDIDPYNTPGDPESGLIPLIQEGDGGTPGEADHRVQAYNFRLCFTDVPSNRMELKPPPGYDPARYELAARRAEAIVASGTEPRIKHFCNPVWMPNRKTDINNSQGISTDFIGENYAYPDGDAQTREQIIQRHEDYVRGFWYFMSHSMRIPEGLRNQFLEFGPCRDEFHTTGGWSPQLYVREARRMVSDYVMTEHNCRGAVVVADSVGMAAYGMDSHNCQRIVKNGVARNEGDVQVHGLSPYPVAFQSIVPTEEQCDNLIVPVCLSATHIAFGSIRMEPVFMVLGQSAGVVATLALDSRKNVQDIDRGKLKKKLLEFGQVLEHANSRPASHWMGSADGDWHRAENWASESLPVTKASIVINREGATLSREFDVNVGSLAVGYGLSQSGSLVVSGGELTATAISSRKSRIGFSSGRGEVLMSGGVMTLTSLQIGLDALSEGSLEMTGGELNLTRSISDELGSICIGDRNVEGSALLRFRGGRIQTRSGVTIGHNDGTGAFEFHTGTDAEFKVGNVDGGFWVQNPGTVLRLVAGGQSNNPIQIESGTKNSGDVVFGKRSRLETVFSGQPVSGSWDILRWEGELNDEGLALADGVDRDIWSFRFVDTDESGTADTLRIEAKVSGK